MADTKEKLNGTRRLEKAVVPGTALPQAVSTMRASALVDALRGVDPGDPSEGVPSESDVLPDLPPDVEIH